jgi:hypothetical protein
LPRPSSAFKPSHSPDSVACPGLGGICLAFDETLRVILCCCVAFGLCMVSCELVLCVKMARFTLHSNRLRLELHPFFPCNLMLLELLEALFGNISVVSGSLEVLKGNAAVHCGCFYCFYLFGLLFARGVLFFFV